MMRDLQTAADLNADSSHPMDNILVRPLDFKASQYTTDQVLWSRTNPYAAMFLNAFSVHVPYFERYLIRTMSVAKKKVGDMALKKDISAIIGQEAHHAKNFIEFNRVMTARYPKMDPLEMQAKAHFKKRANTDSFKRLVGFTAGYETFTFLAGMIVLAEYETWMADSDAHVKALWVWHQVEEVEHGGVAFDVYKHFFSKNEWYRKYMIGNALTHITLEVVKAYAVQCKAEGYHSNPVKFLKAYFWLFKNLTKMLINSFPAFSRSYHPKRHPLVTTKQNKIALGWRRFTNRGGDPVTIDRDKMRHIIGELKVLEA